MNKRFARTLALSLLIVAITCLPALADDVIKIGFMPAEDELPLYVAEKEGLFVKEGVKVEFVTFASAVERDTALRAGQVDGVNADIIALILNAKAGLKVVATSMSLGESPREGRFAIFAAPGAKIKSVADLKGVPVAVSGNTIQDYVSDQLMLAGGLKQADIEKLDVPKVPIRFQMLLGGQVKAAALPDPMGALAEAQGATLVASDTDSKKNLSPIIYMFLSKSIETKPEAFRKFYKVYREAVAKINANPEKYRALLVEKARVPEQIKDTYPMQRYPMPMLPTKDEFNMTQQWMLAKKMLDQPLKYEALFDARFTK